MHMSYPVFSTCPAECPGCRHRHLTMNESIAQKTNYLCRILEPWTDVIDACQTLNQEPYTGYRTRISLTAQYNGTDWQFGLMKRDKLIPIENCPVQTGSTNHILQLLSHLLPPPSGFPLGYYIQSGKQITLVVKSKNIIDSSFLTEAFEHILSEYGFEGLWIHLNPSAGKRMFTKNGWHLMWGSPFSRDEMKMIYGPSSFRQLIPSLYKQSVDEAEKFLQLTPDHKIADLYCGGGYTLTRWMEKGADTIGVELDGRSIENARRNAPNATILRGKCSERIPQLNAWINNDRNTKHFCIYVNPPRSGIEPEVLDWMITTARPGRISYLSCSAGTLRRDLTILQKYQYRIEKIIPYDFFPHTHHVEQLALISHF